MAQIWNPVTSSWEEEDENEVSVWDPSRSSYTTQNEFNSYQQQMKQQEEQQKKEEKKKNTSFFAPLNDGFQFKDIGSLIGNTGKTVANLGINVGKTFVKGTEAAADTITFAAGHGINNIRSRLGFIDDDEYKRNRDAIDIEIGRNKTKELMEDIGLTSDKMEKLDEGSLIKHDTLDRALKTGANMSVSAAQGAAKTVEGWYDTLSDWDSRINDGLAHNLGVISDEEYNKRREKVRQKIAVNGVEEGMKALGWDEEMWNQFEDGSFSKRDNMLGQVSEAVGGMVPNLLVGQAAGLGDGSGTYKSLKGLTTSQKIFAGATNFGKATLYNLPSNLSLAGSVYGNSLEEAYANGATDSEAAKYAIMQSSAEIATEWITGGIPGLEGTGILDKGADFLLDKATGKIKKEAVKGLIKTLGKAGYEVIGEGVEEGLSEILSPMIKNATYSKGEKINWDDVVSSAIVGGITGGFLNLPGTINDVSNVVRENQQVINGSENNDVSIANEPNSSELDLSNINTQDQQTNQNTATNDSNIDNIQNTQYEYVKSDNTKIDNLRKSASENLERSERTTQLVNTVEKVIEDKNYNVLFDSTIINDKGVSVNAQIKTLDNGEVEIRLNPNSDRAGEFLLVHEITHSISNDDLRSFVNDYASKNKDFANAIKSLEETYGTTDISDEVLADISGQLFGNQEFINSLQTSNTVQSKNIIKRVYESLKRLLNKLTEEGRYRNFVQDLETKWREAYKNITNEQIVNNLNHTTSFSIKQDSNGNNYVDIDVDQELFDNLSLKEKRQMAKMVIMEKYSNNGINFDGDNINVNSNTSRKYTDPNTELKNYVKEAKYRLSTELDNLLNASKKINKSPVPDNIEHKKHNFAKDGWNYYYAKFKFGNNEFIGKLNVGINKNQKTLYDVNDINTISEYKKMADSGKLDKTSVTLIQPFLENNISQNSSDVKSDISSTKYSMQENVNNTQKLEKNNYSNLKEDNTQNSLTDKNWQQHLEENYKSSGTKTVLKDIKSTKKKTLPYINTKSVTGEEKSYYEYVQDKINSLRNDLKTSKSKKVSENLKPLFDSGYSVQDIEATLNNIERNIIDKPKKMSKLEKLVRNKFELDFEKYTQEYEEKGMSKNQKKILENESTISKLKEAQQDIIKRIDDKISQKQNLYDQLKSKETKKAADILQQVEMLKNQQANRKLEYEDRIKRLTERNKNLNEKDNSTEFKRQEQRALKQDEYRELAFKMTENMVEWKDKSRGISYEINTMKRNLYDIMSNEEATRMYETYFRPITDNNAKMEKYVNSYNEKINKLNLSQKEAVAVQMLGEYKYNKETLVTGGQVDDFIEKNKLDYKKVEKAVEVFRNVYDEVIVETNKVLAEQGMKTIEYRKGYFPHFVDQKPVTRFGKIAEKLGFKVNDDKLPTDIAGITDMFKPGKVWFRNAQQRKGKYTDFNALKGYDNYIRGAAEVIFHTEDIQKLRALESVIRYQYTDSSFAEELDKIYKDISIDADEKQRQVDELKAKVINPLGNFATVIKDYTDSLANKKAIGDRSLEHSLGREIYSTMTNIQSRVSANMVGLNVSSALTNFIPITQAYSQISTKNMAKAIRETISSQHKTDNLSNASTFLTNRNNQAERLYKTKLDTLNQKASLLFESIDDFTSNVIVRGKYYENVEKGMSDIEALRNADEFAKDIMAGRDKGSMPTIMNRKNPLMKLFTAFQLEVNNQYGYMLKDMPRDLKDEGLNKLIGAFAKMFLGAWLYNKFSESVTGRKSAFSPIDIVGDAVNTVQNENMSEYDKFTTILEDVAGEVPFIGGLIGGGRLPISSALPDFANTTEALFNLSDKEKRDNSLKTLKSELMKPVFYVVMPFGGGQIKKTIEGASMYSHDLPGSYTSNGKLRFEADNSAIGVAKSLAFGQYASKNAKEYFDNGYAPLTQEQQEEIKKLGISVNEYREYRSAYSDLNKIKADKNSNGDSIPGSASGKKAYSIINNKTYSKDQKNYLLDAISKNSGITVDDLNNLENNEDIFKYFYSLNNDKKREFLDEIKNNNFTSRQLYDYNIYKKQMEDKYVNVIAKQQVIDYIQNSNLTSDQKLHLYFKNYGSEEQSYIIQNFNIDSTTFLNTINYVNNIKDEFSGSSYSDYRKNKIFDYINSLNLSTPQKVVLFRLSGYSLSNYKSSMFNYINSMNLSKYEKDSLWNYLY